MFCSAPFYGCTPLCWISAPPPSFFRGGMNICNCFLFTFEADYCINCEKANSPLGLKNTIFLEGSPTVVCCGTHPLLPPFPTQRLVNALSVGGAISSYDFQRPFRSSNPYKRPIGSLPYLTSYFQNKTQRIGSGAAGELEFITGGRADAIYLRLPLGASRMSRPDNALYGARDQLTNDH